MIKPKALQSGDRVAIITPASPFNWSDLENGANVLRSLGLEVDMPQKFSPHNGYLAGTDSERAEQLHGAFADKSIKGIFCARGGYGSMRLVSSLKAEILSQNPKVFVGYSDVTTLLNVLTTNYSLVTFHGPMVVQDLDPLSKPKSLDWLKRAIMSTKPLGEVLPQLVSGREGICISPGNARGILVGGNLSLVVATLGTDFEIQTDGKILFLEDRGERPYRLDRLLLHLKLAKKFSKVAGVLLGEFLDCQEPGKSSVDNQEEALAVIREVLADIKVPILYGFPAGHGGEKITLPLGVSATLEADRGVLTILESGVV